MRIGSQAGYLLEIADMRAIGFTARLTQIARQAAQKEKLDL
jgi:hypothetical protein